MVNILFSPLLYISLFWSLEIWGGVGPCMDRAFSVLYLFPLKLIFKLLKSLFWGVGLRGTFKRALPSQVDQSVPLTGG